MDELSISGAYLFTPRIHTDDRGAFLEWYREGVLASVVGHPLRLAQANLSLSRHGVLRGVHYADVPPGQAKYISCVRGAIMDVVVDLRVGSPTFGQWESVRLDEDAAQAMYISEGLGHAFLALSEDATVVYMCSEGYAPAREHGVHALDPELGIAWPKEMELVLSPRDAEAPSLAEALAAGMLPDYRDCLAYEEKLRGQFT